MPRRPKTQTQPQPKRERFDIYPSEQLLQCIDSWRFSKPHVPTRADAARRLLEIALETERMSLPAA